MRVLVPGAMVRQPACKEYSSALEIDGDHFHCTCAPVFDRVNETCEILERSPVPPEPEPCHDRLSKTRFGLKIKMHYC